MHDHTCHAVGDIVMSPRRVVDAVASAARGAALKTAELSNQSRVVEQLDAAGIKQRQQVAVEVGLGPVGDVVVYAMNPEAFARPLAVILIDPNRVIFRPPPFTGTPVAASMRSRSVVLPQPRTGLVSVSRGVTVNR